MPPRAVMQGVAGVSQQSKVTMGNIFQSLRTRGLALAVGLVAALAFGTVTAAAPAAVAAESHVGSVFGSVLAVQDQAQSETLGVVTVVLSRQNPELGFSEVARSLTVGSQYNFDNLIPGTYALAGLNETADSPWAARSASASETPFVVAAGSPTGTGLTFERLTGSISGTVTSQDNGTAIPLANAQVVAQSATTITRWAMTDESGAYTIDDLRLESYVVSFSLYDTSTGFRYEKEFWDNQPTADTATPVIVEPSALNATNVDAMLTSTPVETNPHPTPTNPTSTDGESALTQTGGESPAAAQTEVTISPDTASGPAATTFVAGGTIPIAMSGFQPFEVVNIWLYSTPVLLGTLTADAGGNIAGSFTIPAGTPGGTHHIVMFDESGTQYTSVDLTVTRELAKTGASASPLWFALAIMMLGGVAVLFAARIRRIANGSSK
ncbi:LPXTG cell wall anchor domain-containing protein [Cryobacterium frigoriphilum]|uniref:LPXTG cell wall anchor domain-containing protein n=1 Tax=Cryobacterium frigoriphilum TaxID=1259150 RepID=A0A4R8ZVN2_9MICO|nr:carboxypeptidase-like regulatory domain-containing protein [Cryobacterium frigoriphilum]TFD47319.1 LPXTG cell wall anchor domain-containing protein [Cryobacterium frigoriphilum]